MTVPNSRGRRRALRTPARRTRFAPSIPSPAVPSPTLPTRAVPALVLGLALASSGAQAQTTPPVAGPLDAVTVTATRTPSRVSEAVAEVTVVERDEIERATGRTLSELLARQPGLQVTSNGGLGKISGISIRGLEPRHTLLLVDGVRLGSATVGTPSFDNLPLALIDRIEIVRGPMSSLYGSDAVGGVVQVFTRRAQPGLVPNAFATVGTNRYAQLGGGLAFGSGAFDGAVQLVHTGAYNPDADGFNQEAGNLRLGWQLSPDWRLDAMALEVHGTTRYDDGLGVDARAKLKNSVQSLQASGRLAPSWTTRATLARSADVYDTLSSASPFTPLGATKTDQTQLAWENLFATPAGTLLALVERLEQKVSRPGQPYSVGDRTIDAVGLGLTGESGRSAWQAGLRHDSNSQFGGQTTGRLGYGFALTPTWRLGGSYGTSFVAPSFNQLYFPGFGSPNLQPEEGKHGELSLRWTSGNQSLRTAWVDNRIRGYIASGPLPTNVPSTRIDGLVTSWEGRWTSLVAGASYEHLDPRNTTPGANYDKQLIRRAKDAFRAQADWLFGEYSVGGTVSAFSGRYEDAANTLKMGGFTTLDLRADWRYDRAWTVGLRVNNLTGKAYETAYGFNQPGRETYVTLRWSPPAK
jgi:vitamin B12 transporter